MFKLEIKTGNAAFGEDPAMKIARILIKASQMLLNGHTESGLWDINGNKVGSFKLVED